MVDISLADQIINLHSPEDRDSVRIVLTESLLKIHDTTREELDTNLYIYMSDFQEFNKLTDGMRDRYDALKKQYSE